ncbi:hypothetical protein B7R21_06290 [Subtercola boreus]|uniref:Uncharacterized protein n=1 Tax=Subtercola boreus TaxID=120213 RepID=A0A3E0VXU4_9MICO|nr:hypothetical protein [Subtercola boreus]RFA14551.1 hypothetical protein B7R21_06290 [Subtercola boreus]
MRIERTDQGELDKIVSAPQEQGVATPLRNSSVSGGQTRFNGESSLIVNGSEDVFGTLNVQGTLNADGTVNLTTTINITGVLTVEGPADFSGDETHVGTESHTGDITNIGKTTQQGDYEGTGHFKQTGDEQHTGNIENVGTTTQKGDINIVAPGILRVGAGITMSPFAAGGGRIDFNPGGRIVGTSAALTLLAPDGTTYIVVGNNGLTVSGYASVQDLFTTGGVYLRNLTTAPTGVTITPLYLGSDGRVYK